MIFRTGITFDHAQIPAANDGTMSSVAGRARCSTGFSTRVRLNALLTSATWVNACGKLPTSRFSARVVFLAQQADVVAQRQQPVEQAARILPALLQDIGVDQPEAAGEERALPRRQAVIRCLGVVAHDESVDQQPLLDRLQGAAHARVIRRQEADARQQQQAGVELLRIHRTARSCRALGRNRAGRRRRGSLRRSRASDRAGPAGRIAPRS